MIMIVTLNFKAEQRSGRSDESETNQSIQESWDIAFSKKNPASPSRLSSSVEVRFHFHFQWQLQSRIMRIRTKTEGKQHQSPWAKCVPSNPSDRMEMLEEKKKKRAASDPAARPRCNTMQRKQFLALSPFLAHLVTPPPHSPPQKPPRPAPTAPAPPSFAPAYRSSRAQYCSAA
jgi:hypothetical protein